MDHSGLPPSLKKRYQRRVPSSSWVGSVVERLRFALYASDSEEEEVSGDDEGSQEIVNDRSFSLLNDIVEQTVNRSSVDESLTSESIQVTVPGIWPTPRVKGAHSNLMSQQALSTPTTSSVARTESTPCKPVGDQQGIHNVSDQSFVNATEGNQISAHDQCSQDASFVTAIEGNLTSDVSHTHETTQHESLMAEEGDWTLQLPSTRSQVDVSPVSEVQFYDGSTVGEDDLLDSPAETDESLLSASEDIDMEDDDGDISIEDLDDLEAEMLTNDEFEVEELDEEDISEASELEPQVTEPEDVAVDDIETEFIDMEESESEDIDVEEIEPEDTDKEIESENIVVEELEPQEIGADDVDEPEQNESDIDSQISERLSPREDDEAADVIDLVDDSPEYEYINNEEYVATDHEENPEELQYEHWDNYNAQQLANIFTAIESADTAGLETLDPEYSVGAEVELLPISVGTEPHVELNAPSAKAPPNDDSQTELLPKPPVEGLLSVKSISTDEPISEPVEADAPNNTSVSQSVEPEECRVGFNITIGPHEEPADVLDALPDGETPEVVEPVEGTHPIEEAGTTDLIDKETQMDPFQDGDYGLWNLFQVGFTVAPGEGNEKPLSYTAHEPLEEKAMLKSMAEEALFLCSRSRLFGGASAPSRASTRILEPTPQVVPQSSPRRDLSKTAFDLLLRAPLFGGTAPKPRTDSECQMLETKKPLPKRIEEDPELKLVKTRRQSRRLAKSTEQNSADHEELQGPDEPTGPIEDFQEYQSDKTPNSRKRRAKTTPASSAKKRARRTSQTSQAERRRTLRNGKTLPEPE